MPELLARESPSLQSGEDVKSLMKSTAEASHFLPL